MKDLIPPIDTPDGLFHDGNPLTGELGTIVTALIMNNLQAALRSSQNEIISAIKAGLPDAQLDESNSSQLITALKKLFLQSGNNFSEIKAVGTTAQTAARTNIAAAALVGLATQVFSVATATGDNHAVNLKQLNSVITALSLGNASTRVVGTGANQIPDMSSFTFSGTFGGWVAKLPQGLIIQGGVTAPISSAPYDTGFAFPIPFPNQVLNIWDFNIAPTGGSQKVEWSFNNPSLLGGSVRAIGVVVQGSSSINSPFSGLTCGWIAIGR